MVVREIVLPSGKFAAFRKIETRDLISAWDENEIRMSAQLAARIVMIDGMSVTYEEVEGMELNDFMPLCAIIGDLLPKGLGRGIA